jgi:C-terminal region of aryl-sulfatase
VLHGNYKAHFWTQGNKKECLSSNNIFYFRRRDVHNSRNHTTLPPTAIQYNGTPTPQKYSTLKYYRQVDPGEAYPLSAKDDPNYAAEIAAIEQAAKEHIQSFIPGSPEFNMYAPASLHLLISHYEIADVIQLLACGNLISPYPPPT